MSRASRAREMGCTRTAKDPLVLQLVELDTVPARSGARDRGAAFGQGGGGLAVTDADQLVAVEGEAGQAGQRALPAPRIMGQPAALGRGSDHPDRELVADQQ